MCDDSFVPTCILSLARLLVNKACLDRVELLMDLEGGCGGLVVESLFWRDLEVVWGRRSEEESVFVGAESAIFACISLLCYMW
jgi:hypothetical protein